MARKKARTAKQKAATRKLIAHNKKRHGKHHRKGRKGKRARRGCGKRKWAKGGNAYWKCKKGAKKHAYNK